MLGISVGGHFASSAIGVELAKANEAGGNVVGSFFKALWDKIARNNSFDGAAGALTQMGLLTIDKWKYGIQYIQLSQHWTKVGTGLWEVPKSLRWIADSSWTSMLLVHKVTGWSPLGASWNPMAKPTTFKEGLKAFGGRTLMQLNGMSNRVALNPKDQPYLDKLGKVSKGLSKVATWTGFITTSVSSWQSDSQTYPAMGNVEKGARAATSATASTVGGLAGAKAGAAAGAALGSFVGPVGTGVGAVAGGIIGGLAGGKAGAWFGDKTKGWVGETASGIWDKITN